MWRFMTRLGILRIQKLPNSRFGLYLDTDLVNSFHSAEAAAEAVYRCSTGHYAWDISGPVIVPKDLNDWEYVES